MAKETSNFVDAWIISLLKLNKILTREEYSKSVEKLGRYVKSVRQAKRKTQ